jgi:hypothetical protein
MDGPRRNSDGTLSFPSQNPYTDRRPDEPRMPKGMEWSMLSKEEKERLRGLAKEHAENIGLHILAAFSLEESDPEAALEHAKWVARQASRIDFSRETLAFVAYRQSDYKLALREFRTAYRMNGFADYLPFIADCERGVGNPKKAVELAMSDEGKQLVGAAKAEMFLVYAGALGDLKMWDKAIDVAHTLGRSKGLPGEYRMRAVQAEQYFLEEAGRGKEAEDLNDLIERLESEFADEEIDENSEDVVIDHDLEELTDDSEVLEQLGIDPDEAQYAPELEYDDDDYYDDSDDSDESDESDESESDEADDDEADSDDDDSDDTDESDDAESDDAESDDAESDDDEESEESSNDSDDVENGESDDSDDTDDTDDSDEAESDDTEESLNDSGESDESDESGETDSDDSGETGEAVSDDSDDSDESDETDDADDSDDADEAEPESDAGAESEESEESSESADADAPVDSDTPEEPAE